LLAEEVLIKTLGGQVLSVDTEKNILGIDFLHPATGEREKLFFLVNGSTDFRGVAALRELRPKDPVTVDYVEEDSMPAARLVSRVPLSGPPDGLEKFPKF